MALCTLQTTVQPTYQHWQLWTPACVSTGHDQSMPELDISRSYQSRCWKDRTCMLVWSSSNPHWNHWIPAAEDKISLRLWSSHVVETLGHTLNSVSSLHCLRQSRRLCSYCLTVRLPVCLSARLHHSSLSTTIGSASYQGLQVLSLAMR